MHITNAATYLRITNAAISLISEILVYGSGGVCFNLFGPQLCFVLYGACHLIEDDKVKRVVRHDVSRP